MKMLSLPNQQQNRLSFKQILKKLFSTPAIVLIGSFEGGKTMPWKTGKTDFFLKVSEMLMEMGLVDEVATNVETFGKYPYISDLETLKLWLSKDDKVKLYGLDEANVHLPARRAMSTKSVDILQVFPEISKSRSRLIIIAQMLSRLDSELRNFGWVRGKMVKVSLKSVYIVSPYFKGKYYFNNISRTSIKFNPYLQAPFTLKPTMLTAFPEIEYEKAWQWLNGNTPDDWAKHPMTIHREVSKVLKTLLIEHSQLTHIAR